jgi:mannosylfructose-phosphate synthase
MTRPIRRIAMLSTHGYFDPVPRLGQTDTGGQVTYVLELARALSRLGIMVDIFTRWFDRDKPQVDPLPGTPGVRVIRIPAGPWEFVAKEEIYGLLPGLSANMSNFIRDSQLDYDLFHGHYVDGGIAAVKVASTFNRPCFFTPHSLGAWKRVQLGGDPIEMDLQFNFRHREEEEVRLFRACNASTVTSSLQHEKLTSLYPYNGDRVEVIPPGVDIHRFSPLGKGEKDVAIPLPDKYIYCLSRIDTNKGHDLLLEAFSRVHREIPDVHLVIGGGSPDPKPREKEVFGIIHRLIEKFSLQEYIHFVGLVPGHFMAPFYRQARFFVMPSIFEPFGMTTQESMACGVPVIASKYGGIKTVLDHWVNGVLVDPRDLDEFSSAMIRLLTESGLREKLGECACRLVREQFSWEAIAGSHLRFYRKYYQRSKN